MRKGFTKSTSSRWNTDAPKLAFKIVTGGADLNPSDFFLRPPPLCKKGTPTDYCNDQAAFDEGAVLFLCVS